MVRGRLAVAFGVLLLGLPPLPRAYAGPGPAQNMLTTAANASLPVALANLDLGAVWGRAYGVKCDGATDDTSAIQNAIAAAAGAGNTAVYLPQGTCIISASLTVGNGTPSAASSVNGITIMGGGAPFARLGLSGNLAQTGTILKWAATAPSGGTMAEILGPAKGVSFANIAFNANNRAGTCLRLTSASRGIFPHITCADYTGTGLVLRTQSGVTYSGDAAVYGTSHNIFIDPEIETTNTGTVAVSLDGDVGPPAHDSTANQFINPVLNIPGTLGTIGFRVAFADQNVVTNLIATISGTPDGTGCTIDFVGTAANGGHYPQANTFTPTDLGVGGYVCAAGTIGEGNSLGDLTGLDAPNLPAPGGIVDQMVPYHVIAPGQFPTGGFWSEGGLNIEERQFRNKLINSGFRRASRGTSFVNPAAAGTYTLDLWKLLYDATQTATISQQAFPPGQTDVPYAPGYYLDIAYGTNTGGTYYLFGQPIEDVGTFAGRSATISAWIKATSCTPQVKAYVAQNFGSGGSTAVTTNAAALTTLPNDATWHRYGWTIAVPGIAGKTVGAGDYLTAGFHFDPATMTGGTCTVDIAQPQAEYGILATAYEIRPRAVDEAMAARYLRVAGAGLTGAWISATQAFLAVPFGLPMRATPTVSLIPGTATVTIATPGSGSATSSTAQVAASPNCSPTACEITSANFTGQTAFRPAVGTADFVLLSAEY